MSRHVVTRTAEGWERRVQFGAHPVLYPLMELISRRGPVVRVPRVGVVASDADVARQVLMDTASFTKTGPGSPADLWTPVVGPTALLNMEGADHLELRRKLGPLFSPTAVTALCSRAGDALLADLPSRIEHFEAVDVVQLARQLAGAAICELVGLPANPAQFSTALSAASRITSAVRLGRRGLTPGQVSAARKALGELTTPARVAWAAGDPRTVPGRMRELELTQAEAIGAVAAFILVGTETLISFVPRLLALLLDSGWWRRVCAEPDIRDKTIGEALRFTVPSPVMLRSVVQSAFVGAVAVSPGDRVVIATALASRTQRAFDPATCAAADLRQLWFGAGSHFCLGMPLAMAQIRLVMDAFVLGDAASGGLRVLRRQVQRRTLIPGYRRLVIGRG